jgi:uncharacterized membrane protein
MAENELSAEQQIHELNERLKYQEQVLYQQIARIYALEKRLGIAPEYKTELRPAPPPPLVEPVTPPVASPPLPPPAPVAPEMLRVEAPPAAPETPTPAARPAAPAWFSLEGKDLESLIGGNWFSRIGILCIILSTGFFLKYAFEHEMIGPTGRVMIGVLLGIGFVIGGERLRAQGYRYYAHGLSGGGIAILYLSIFAAFARYQLIGQMPAFALMSGVTALAVLQAARYDALAIAVLGLIGGFLTPILLSTGKDNQIGLFSYIALLDLGVLSVAYFKQWRVLNYLAYIATVLMSAGWMNEWYAPEKLRTTIFFFTLLFVIFALLAVLYNVINRTPARAPEIILILLNAGLYFGVSYELLEAKHTLYLGLFSVVVSGFYLGLGYLTYSRDREDRYLVLTFLGLASLFLTLAIPIQLNQHWVTMAWAIEGVILTWIGLRADSRLTRYAALAVLGIALFHWLNIDLMEFRFREPARFFPVFNQRGISALVLIASLAGVAWLYRKHAEQVPEHERMRMIGALALVANALAVLWLSVDLRDVFEQAKAPLYARAGEEPWQWDAIGRLDSLKHLLLTLFWCMYAGVLMFIGFAKRLSPLRWASLALLSLAAMKVFIFDAEYATAPWRRLILNPAFGAFVVLAATLALMYREYKRRQQIAGIEGIAVPPVLLAAANLIALIGLSLEINGHFAVRGGGGDYDRAAIMASTKQFALTALWSLYGAVSLAIVLRGGSEWRGYKWLRFGAVGLLGLAALKVITYDGIYAVSGRTPIFNLTFAGFLIVVAALAYAYWLHARLGPPPEAGPSRLVPGLLIVTNVLAVYALSLEAESYFSAAMRPLEYDSESWRNANLARQLWLSVIWALYGGAMLVAGLWRRNRLLRLMALLLLGMTILKVFLVDLSALDNIYRVISFVVLGVILLVVSFLYQKLAQRVEGGSQG